MTFLFCVLFLLMIKELDEGPQFQILRKLSQDPVHTAMPSSVTPRQLTRLSCPARTPALSQRIVSQMLQLLSSYPAISNRPDLLKATEVMPQMILSWLYTANSWSLRMSHSLADASQAPDTKVRMSGERERDITSPVWPVYVVDCCPVSMSHRAQVMSPLLVTILLSSRNRQQLRYPV